MRTFLQNSVDEEFYYDLNYTVAVRSDRLEFIFELDNAYSVIHIIGIGKREVMALAYWGDYFKPLEGPSAYTMLGNMKSKCPTLYKLFNSPDEYFCPKMKEGLMGVAKKITVDRIPALWMLDDDKVLDAAHDVMLFSVDLYNEILKNCPLKDWVRRLEEI